MITRCGLVLAIVLSCSLIEPSSAQAQYGVGGAYGGYYGAWDVGRLYSGLSQNVPYFAAYPPVYYSAPVPRTYGYSPFAYPPGTRTPEIVSKPAPVEIINPHFKASAPIAKPKGDQVTRVDARPAPLEILNPYTRPVLQASLLTD